MSPRPLDLEKRFEEGNSYSSGGGLSQGSLGKSQPYESMGQKRMHLRSCLPGQERCWSWGWCMCDTQGEAEGTRLFSLGKDRVNLNTNLPVLISRY